MRERLRIQRKQEQATPFPFFQNDLWQQNSATPEQGGYEVPSLVHEVLSSSGQPLDTETRSFMEPRFGHDFSQVRVHADERAAESAQAVNALAYTVGSDVVFGPGEYTPTTSKGKRLLAHELTHVVQQGSPTREQPTQIGMPGSTAEQEANAISNTIARSTMISSVSVAQNSLPAQVQRTPDDDNQSQPATSPMPQQTQVTVEPPPAQQLSNDEVQALNQQHPPVNVQAGGSAPPSQQQQATPPQQGSTQQGTESGPHLELGADSDPFQYKFTLSLKDFDLFHYGIGGVELGILNEPSLEIDLSRNPSHFGSFAGAQASVNLFRLHLGKVVELSLGQIGIGVDDKGLPIIPMGAEADFHAGPVDINVNVSGHMDTQDGLKTNFDTVTAGIKLNF